MQVSQWGAQKPIKIDSYILSRTCFYSHEESSVVTVVAGCETYGHCITTAINGFAGFIVIGAEAPYSVVGGVHSCVVMI